MRKAQSKPVLNLVFILSVSHTKINKMEKTSPRFNCIYRELNARKELTYLDYTDYLFKIYGIFIIESNEEKPHI